MILVVTDRPPLIACNSLTEGGAAHMICITKQDAGGLVRLHLLVAALHAWCIKWLRLQHVLQAHQECFQVRLAGQCRKIGHCVISITPSGFQFRQHACLAVLVHIKPHKIRRGQ